MTRTHDRSPPPAALARRTLLKGAAAGALAAGTAGLAPGALLAATPDRLLLDFQQCSAALNGMASRNVTLAGRYVALFTDPHDQAGIATLAHLARETPAADLDAAIARHGLDALANRIVRLWYTGQWGDGETRRTLDYIDAMAWEALDSFTKAPSHCGPQFGHWQHHP